MGKNTYHHGDLRQSLIDGAIALIQETGLSDLSLRHVARQAGVSHNAPYRHFEDKEALLTAVAEQGFHALRSAMDTAKQAIPPKPAQQLEAIGLAYVEFALACPAHYRVMFGEYQSDRSMHPELAKAGQQAFMVLVDTIQEGQTAGVFRPDDPIDLARVAWSLVHGQSMLALDNQLQIMPGKEFEKFLEFSSQILLQGLGAIAQASETTES